MAAGMGKLQEIDLGPEAAARNVQLTEQARLRFKGHTENAVPETNTTEKRRPKRWQKRRNSEDERRDMMVEAVLRESKLGYFSEDAPARPSQPSGADADSAMAEQFHRDYMETIESNRIARKPAAAAGATKDAPKGPKMGGSRSARAAMALREREEKTKGGSALKK